MVGLIDSTLREGEQMAGVYFSMPQKLEIIRLLGKIGVEEIELGVAGQNPEMPELIAAGRSHAPHARLSLWCRCIQEDIEVAAALKPDVVTVSVPVSDIHLTKRLKKGRSWVFSQLQAAVLWARSAGARYIAIGFEDALRADIKFVESVFERVIELGVHRIRFSDTVGTANPLAFVHMASKFAKQFDVELAVHAHNDFGMATANSVSALEAGFDWADASVLGLGERAGIARLEEVVTYLRVAKSHSCYDISMLMELCELVAEVVRARVYPHHAVIGENVFRYESGLHLDGLAKDPTVYEPFPPEMVNASREKLLGKKAGRNALLDKMSDLGIPVSDDRVALLLSQVRTQSRLMNRPLMEEEIRSIAAVTG